MSLVATGFPTHQRKRSANINYYWEFTLRSHGVRRDGSAALDLARWPAGASTRFWEFGLKSWDTAAGVLLVEEAGGMVTDLTRRPYRAGRPARAGHRTAGFMARCRKSRRSPSARAHAILTSCADERQRFRLRPAARRKSRSGRWPNATRRGCCCSIAQAARGTIGHFANFPICCAATSWSSCNNARVLPARLFGRRAGIHAQDAGRHNPARGEFLQAPIEVLLVRRAGADCWEALVRPGRKVPVGERIVFGDGELEARVEGRGEFGLRVLRFSAKNGFAEALARLGHIPLPPYIKREDEPADRERYQTVFARRGKRRCGAHGGTAFHAGDSGAAARARNRNRRDHPRCRSGDV